MLLDEVYEQTYTFAPKDFTPEPIIRNFDEALKNAPSRDDLAFQLSPDYRNIYLAYLKDAEETHPHLHHSNPNDLATLEGKVAQNLYKDQYPYDTIIHIMTNSPNVPKGLAKDRRVRWGMASLRVSKNLNPLLSMPEVTQARPLHQYGIGKGGSDKDLYFSSLKTVLEKKPELRLKEADAYVVKLLTKNRFKDTYLENVLSYSPQFDADYQDVPEDDKSKLLFFEELHNNMKAFIQEAQKDLTMPKAESKAPIMEATTETPTTKDTNEEILHQFMQKIQVIRSKQKQVDAVSYWKTIMDSIKKTFELLDINKVNSCCKLLIDWCEGAEKATREMNLQEHPEVRQIQRDAALYLKKTQLMQEDWDKLFTMLMHMEKVSNQLICETMETVKKNPLLQSPAVYTATPFEKLIRTPAHKPEEFYYSALRKAVLDEPGLDLLTADLRVKDLLGAPPCNFDTHQKAIVLAHSPRYRGLAKSQREQEASHWITVTDAQRRMQKKEQGDS
ncbi:MAG: hypothetical protein ACI4OH_05180 [Mitsuokella sp.]|uniref:hypothetical protein n=1 Tax=Mitsuokella sp. TaxID=2049034 RepID=UPI003EFED8F5